MEFHQYYLGCLAHASYLIGSEGEAAIVDPQRDVDAYLADAEARGLAIRHVLLTHLHADFVSGHVELARRTGATIAIGARAGAEFEHRALSDGDEIRVGAVRIVALETPGHTPESVTYLVYESAEAVEAGAPSKALTGDTLFIGSVGRPDLVGSQGLTPEEMAGMLYDSLHEKILTLPDDVVVYPAHGAGSACGKGISTERFSTLGEQRRTNYALQPMTREEFVEFACTGLGTPPRYFAASARANRRGAPGLDELEAPPALTPAQCAERQAAGATVLDVRKNTEYGAGHVPGSLNVGLGGNFASWCGTLLDPAGEIVLVGADEDQIAEARMRLARVGLENVSGALAGGVAAWEAEGRALGRIEQVDVDELARRTGSVPELQILDVRTPGEVEGGAIDGSVSAPLATLQENLDEVVAQLDPSLPTAVVCAGGYRSSAATGILAARGFDALTNVLGGMKAWVEAGHPVVETAKS